MTYPVTGPFEKIEHLNGVNSLGASFRVMELYRRWHRQKPPYDLPLEFDHYLRRVRSYSASQRGGGHDSTYYESVSSAPTTMLDDEQLYAKVYDAFKEGVSADVELGIAFAEGHQSMQMMNNRLRQMATFGDHLLRGRFGKAADTLGVAGYGSTARRRMNQSAYRQDTNAFANNYLEFHFGWSPLLADIYDAAEALSQPILPHNVVVRRTTTKDLVDSYVVENYGSFKTRTYDRVKLRQTIALRAGVEVSNPNLALASQLGLINPATIVWEKVPFSFVADWFVNVGQFLSSFTDFAGLRLIKPHKTTFSHWTRSRQRFAEYLPSDGFDYNTTSSTGYSLESYITKRVVGAFPGPTLHIRDPWVLSPRRGLAAVSLIIQQLRR